MCLTSRGAYLLVFYTPVPRIPPTTINKSQETFKIKPIIAWFLYIFLFRKHIDKTIQYIGHITVNKNIKTRDIFFNGVLGQLGAAIGIMTR